jgi:hypothetical protein
MQGFRNWSSENILDELIMSFCPLVLYVLLVLGLLVKVVHSEKFSRRKFQQPKEISVTVPMSYKFQLNFGQQYEKRKYDSSSYYETKQKRWGNTADFFGLRPSEVVRTPPAAWRMKRTENNLISSYINELTITPRLRDLVPTSKFNPSWC